MMDKYIVEITNGVIEMSLNTDMVASELIIQGKEIMEDVIDDRN
ncbi:MAG: hypothetical protein N4A57_12425 [Anaeromicrobium sp.]|jgi:hypothetical protein|nr:hypothetical protein [Anaeromicrobium sp.]MCT4595058.1 hypothetical protein [Anaeromicrobium sp.]